MEVNMDTDIEEANAPVDEFEKMWINSVKQDSPVDNIFNTAFYEGYKVSIAKLKKLGEEARQLADNQFLLKGYERYKHLLMGKVRYAGEKRAGELLHIKYCCLFHKYVCCSRKYEEE